jgi:hypothetical protein
MLWCLVKYKSNYNILLSDLLLFRLMIVCGNIESNLDLQGTPVSHENTLSIFHANIRSLRNKLSYSIDIVEDFDIIFSTETHLDNSISGCGWLNELNLWSIAYDLHYCPGSKNYRRQNKMTFSPELYIIALKK